MIKTYKSKIGTGLVTFVGVVFGITGYAVFSKGFEPVALAVFIMPLLFIVYVFFSISYTISGQDLHVKSGFLVSQHIDISTIRKIEETNSLFSSPAASLDRLEIFYNKFDSILISPKDKGQFIADMLEINPSIEVKYKK